MLSLRTVRNSEIRAVDNARRTPGRAPSRSGSTGGWCAPAAVTSRRANRAVPIDIGARRDGPTLSAITDWYRDRSHRQQLVWPDRLLPAAHLPGRIEQPVQVLTAEIAQVTGGTSTAEDL